MLGGYFLIVDYLLPVADWQSKIVNRKLKIVNGLADHRPLGERLSSQSMTRFMTSSRSLCELMPSKPKAK